jgi:mannose-1-phosphate guanylyltransferase
MILAAGLGTRLRPLTDLLPKPLVPVGDRPAVAHVAERLALGDLDEAVLNAHHLASAFTADVLARLPIRLRVAHEATILGTAGGVANAAPLLGDGDVLLWNGDILAELDVAAIASAHREAHGASGAVATLVVGPRADLAGAVGLGDDGRVVRLRGERHGEEVASADFLGVHVISPELRARLPVPGCMVDDGYLPALRRGEHVATFPTTNAWDDVGSVASYLAANARWLARAGLSSFVHESALVAPGVEIEGTVVGAGAEVSGSGVVRGSVIWPGARAVAPFADVVVTPAGITPAR